MATRLGGGDGTGGVSINIELDTADALRELDNLEKRVKNIVSEGASEPSQYSPATTGGPSKPPPSPATPNQVKPGVIINRRRIPTHPPNAANSGLPHRLPTGGAVRGGGRPGTQQQGGGGNPAQNVGGNAPIGNAPGNVVGGGGLQAYFANYLARQLGITGAGNPLSSAAGMIKKLSNSPVVQGLVGGAAVYGATRTIATGAPLALEVGKGLAGLPSDSPLTKSVEIQLENLRNSFSYLESYVKSIVTGIGKTYEMDVAVARVTGRVPNITLGYGIYREAAMQEDMLEKKFTEFKDKEVAHAVGRSMEDLFKNGINK